MKVTPVAPQGAAPTDQAQNTQKQDARSRAMAILMGNQGQANTTGADQNNISVEEVSTANVGQTSNTEEISATSEVPEETAATETKTEPAKTDAVASQYALLARQEKAHRARVAQQDTALKAREAALAAKEQEIKAKEQEYATGYIAKSRFKQSPLEVMAEADISYDEISQQVMAQGSVDPATKAYVAKIEAKLAKMEEELGASKTAAQTEQERQYKAAVAQIEKDVKKLVFTNPEFETIKETRSESDVVELIEKTYKEDGVLLTNEEAAQMVEDYLIEEAMKLTRIEKIKKKLAPPAPTVPKTEQVAMTSKEQTRTQQQPQTMKTLTNAVSSPRKLNSRERAIAAFKGERID